MRSRQPRGAGAGGRAWAGRAAARRRRRCSGLSTPPARRRCRITRPASPLPRTCRRSTAPSARRRCAPRAWIASVTDSWRRRRAARPSGFAGQAAAGPLSRRQPVRARPRRGFAPESSMTPEHFADLHVGAVLVIDPAQHAGFRRRDLEVDLVGFELDERIAGRDDVAGLLQPARHARIDDRLADFGNDDICWHAPVLSADVWASCSATASRRLVSNGRARPPAASTLRPSSAASTSSCCWRAVARRRTFRRARASRPRDHADRAAVGGFDEVRPHEVPVAHVLRLFLHPDDFVGGRDSRRGSRAGRGAAPGTAARRGRRPRASPPARVSLRREIDVHLARAEHHAADLRGAPARASSSSITHLEAALGEVARRGRHERMAQQALRREHDERQRIDRRAAPPGAAAGGSTAPRSCSSRCAR